jgi:hypothetical protein
MTCGAPGQNIILGSEGGRRTMWLSLYLGPSVAGAREASVWCCRLGLLCLVVTLPLVGVMWRGYASLCTGL